MPPLRSSRVMRSASKATVWPRAFAIGITTRPLNRTALAQVAQMFKDTKAQHRSCGVRHCSAPVYVIRNLRQGIPYNIAPYFHTDNGKEKSCSRAWTVIPILRQDCRDLVSPATNRTPEQGVCKMNALRKQISTGIITVLGSLSLPAVALVS